MFVFHHCLINLTVRNSGSSKRHYQYWRQFSNLISQCGRETRQWWNVFISRAQDFYNCFSSWLSLRIPPCFSIQTVNTSFDFLDFPNKKINSNDSYPFHHNGRHFWGCCKHCTIHLHEVKMRLREWWCAWHSDSIPGTGLSLAILGSAEWIQVEPLTPWVNSPSSSVSPLMGSKLFEGKVHPLLTPVSPTSAIVLSTLGYWHFFVK